MAESRLSGVPTRCRWAVTPASIRYHDREWGVPCRSDRRLLELLILEGAQAGLSWETILNKRTAYRRAFAAFDATRIARFGARDRRRLLHDVGIVRNRLKIDAAILNARAFLAVCSEFGTFARYLEQMVGPPNSEPRASYRRRTRSVDSDRVSADLVARGFRFVGTTICYAYLQAVGWVNDHEPSCFRAHRIA